MVIDRVTVPDEVLLKKLESKEYFLHFVPEKINHLTEVKKIKYKGENLKTSYLIDIVHGMFMKYHQKNQNSCYLNSLVLKDRYGHKYNYYIDYLKQMKVISKVGNYLVGTKSNRYELCPDVISGTTTRWINSDKILLRKYSKNVFLNEIKGGNKYIHTHIKKKLVLDLFSVDIDYRKSMQYLDNIKDKDSDIYVKNAYSVDSIRNDHIFFHFDKYGRMHTNFTILKSHIRKNFLTIDNEPTFEVDIPNSQPSLLMKLIEDSGTKWVNQDEFELFKELLMYGRYYQYVCDELKLSNKKSAKKLTYKVLFGRNHENSKVDMAFRKLFPTIHNYIKLYKKEKGDYKVLSYDLQQTESTMIYNTIIDRIIDIDPNIKMITVHDSIMGKESDRGIIEKVFYEEMQKYLGI